MSLRSRVVDGIFGGLELFAALYDWVRKLRALGEPEPIPLSRKRDTTIRPPPL